MSRLLLSVGIPGSGKTTYMKKLAQSLRASYICPDEVREEITGDASDQTQNKLVWSLVYSSLEAALTQGKTVVLDATLTKPEVRKEYITLGRSHGATSVEVYFFDVALETALQRKR